jgi:hypothetical protein
VQDSIHAPVPCPYLIAAHWEVLHNLLQNLGFRAHPLARKRLIPKTRRDVRVVEGARLESEAGERY